MNAGDQPPKPSLLDDVTIGMPTCDDDPTILRRVLERVVAEPLANRPVVVDMSHGNAVREVVASFNDGIQYEGYGDSSGVSDSRNRLIELTETRYLVMLDADAIPESGWTHALRHAFDRDPNAAVIGGRCLPEWIADRPFMFDTAPAFDFLGMFDLGEAALKVPRIMGTTYAIDRDRLPAEPPFPVGLGRRAGSLLAFEEVAYCLGVQERGWSVWYEPAAVVRHHVRVGRDSWAWMQKRAFVAGQESRLTTARLEPLPRTATLRDRAFLGLIAPMYLAGRLRGPGAAAKWQKASVADR